MTFARPFLALTAVGLLGILSLIPTFAPAIETLRGLRGGPPLSDAALIALLLMQPTVLLLIAVALGTLLAERVGLVSFLLRRLHGDRQPDTGSWGSTLAVAIVAAVLVATCDLLLRRAFPASFTGIPLLSQGSLPGRLSALLYGGITEELMIRFGLMTLILWLVTRLTGGRRSHATVAIAVIVSALAFALGHLPALMAVTTPDEVLVARTIGLNGALGVLYGLLYAYRSLENAMLAHAATHVVFWIATPLLLLLGL